MTNNKGSKTTIIIIILGILLVGGTIAGLSCYYLYKIGTKEETGQSKTDTAAWLEYTNNRFKFFLKFPKTFDAAESENGDGITLTSKSPAITIYAYATLNSQNQSLDEYLNSLRNDLFKGSESAEEISADETNLGQIPAQERRWQYVNPIDGTKTITDQVTTLKNDNFYSVKMVINASDYSEYSPMFNQILQSYTFK